MTTLFSHYLTRSDLTIFHITAENIADTVRKEYRTSGPNPYPIRIAEIVQNCGVSVYNLPKEYHEHAICHQKQIWVKPDMDLAWTRFSVAHAFSHVVLGHGLKNPIHDHDFGKGGIEGLATELAMHLLIPAFWLGIVIACEIKKPTVPKLASAFTVPEPIMKLAVADLLGYPVDWLPRSNAT